MCAIETPVGRDARSSDWIAFALFSFAAFRWGGGGFLPAPTTVPVTSSATVSITALALTGVSVVSPCSVLVPAVGAPVVLMFGGLPSVGVVCSRLRS